MKMETGVHGRYKLVRTRQHDDGTEEIYETPWFNNLITNNGLDMLGTRRFDNDPSSCITEAYVGTSNTTPANTDTSLGSQVASTSTRHNNSDVSRTNLAPYYFGYIFGFRFSKGDAKGNLSEIGVGRGANNLFSRALIVDANGDPTTLTITGIDILDVYYEFRAYVSHDPVIWTETVNSNSYTGKLICTNKGTFYHLYDTGGTLQSYTNGNYYRDGKFFYGTGSQNHAAGIDELDLGGDLETHMTFDPPMPKDNTQTFEFSIRNSWARRIFQILFDYDGTDLSDWSVTGNVTVVSNTFKVVPQGPSQASYAYIDTGKTDLSSTRIIFDVKLDTAANLFFGTDTTGQGLAMTLQATNTVADTTTVGNEPKAIAYDNSQYMYVTNYSSNNVSVIDTNTNTVTDTISVGNEPKAIAYDNSQYMYVTNYSSNDVSVIDTNTNTVTDTISVGSSPKAIAYDNSQYMYVTNYESKSVSVIDTNTNTVTDTISVDRGPQGIAYDNSQYMYVTSFFAENVSVIDTNTNTVTDTISVGSRPQGIAYDGSQYIYVVNRDSNDVSVIDTNSGFSSITSATDWDTVTTPAGTDIPLFGHGWHNVQIIIDNAGTSADVMYDGVTVKSNISISQSGGCIAMQSADSGARFDNVILHAV